MPLGAIFPGQGSQSIGMLSELAAQYDTVRKTFAEASERLGYDLWRLVQKGPADALNATENAQPAVLTAGVSLWRIWHEEGGAPPILMAGHSLGEYTALACAGAIDFGDAVSLVAHRGRLMQEAVAVGDGAMAAVIGLELDELAELCRRFAKGEVVSCANFNAPTQAVIAGDKEAVGRVIAEATALGASRVVLLPVSVPSHCALMAPAAERLAEHLRGIHLCRPAIPVVHNVDALTRNEAAGIADALAAQLSQPVRWVDVVRTMTRMGVDTLVELGPGSVLTALCRRIDRELTCLPTGDPKKLETALSSQCT
ncbi:MAG: ACP S-malonyltransferase [Gammaproteobacteria bacterium]